MRALSPEAEAKDMERATTRTHREQWNKSNLTSFT